MQTKRSLALIIRSHPYQHRAARAELDIAIAAAVMDYRLEVFFLGQAVLQLIADRCPAAAILPAAYRAWASLPELTDIRAYAEKYWLDRCAWQGQPLVLDAEGMDAVDMPSVWRFCDHVMAV